jgi:hypothetical protein
VTGPQAESEPAGGCGAHPGVSAELRVLLLNALDRLGPVLERVRAEPATPAAETCAVCPLCAVVAALRGERPELAVRLAEHAVGLLAVLRSALADSGPPSGPPDPTTPSAPGRRVQHIPVERTGTRR